MKIIFKLVMLLVFASASMAYASLENNHCSHKTPVEGCSLCDTMEQFLGE